jgi:citrate (Re)-synthase
MLEFSRKTNLLEQSAYRYTLQDVTEPNLYRHLFDYQHIPKVPFNHRIVPMNTPEHIWITDTTFRDGQQACSPFTVDQIVNLYQLLHKLGGPQGLVRQSEFFIYTDKDREAVRRCMDLGYTYPEVTSWIRASEKDFQLVKSMGVRETGILVSCSDYHIFKKMKLNRRQAMEKYLDIVRQALAYDIVPRCHFEDITRADFYGFVVPFANELMKLAQESKKPIKIRACDTLGYGVSYPGVALPRSVPGIIYGLQHYSEVPSEWLEWHGHNDFYKVVNNAATAWLYGCGGVNCSLLGIGERTGNCPLEAMAIEYASLRGTTDGMDLSTITEIASYFESNLGYEIPPRTPFVGRYFNATRAGIHADGLLKDEEIYNIFDTARILNRPATVSVDSHSGLAGIAHWLNNFYGLKKPDTVDKRHPIVLAIRDAVDHLYRDGRNTVMGDEELEEILKRVDGFFYRKMTEYRRNPKETP